MGPQRPAEPDIPPEDIARRLGPHPQSTIRTGNGRAQMIGVEIGGLAVGHLGDAHPTSGDIVGSLSLGDVVAVNQLSRLGVDLVDGLSVHRLVLLL